MSELLGCLSEEFVNGEEENYNNFALLASQSYGNHFNTNSSHAHPHHHLLKRSRQYYEPRLPKNRIVGLDNQSEAQGDNHSLRGGEENQVEK